MAADGRLAAAIETFVHVAERGSFRRAAAALGLTPSAVSKAVSRLEAQLGVVLLERTSRALSLTSEGQLLVTYGRRALDELEAVRLRLGGARDRAAGVVQVEAWPFLGQTLVAPALPALLRRYPELHVRLSLRDQPRPPGAHGVDLSVGVLAPESAGLVVRRAGPLAGRVLLCAAPAYLAAAGVPRTPEELGAHDCLGLVVGERVEPWPFADPAGARALVPRGPLSATSKEVLVDAAVRGLGIVRVADLMVAPLLRAGALTTVLDDYATVERQPVYIARRGGRWLPARVRVVLQHLVDLFNAGQETGAAPRSR